MTAISNYSENQIVNLVLRNTAWAVPTIYVSAHTGDPSETGANELAGGGYQRVAVPLWNAASARSLANTNEIIFPFMAAAVGTVTYYGINDALSGGNFLWQTTSAASGLATAVGSALRVPAGGLVFGFTGEVSTYLANALLNHIFRGVAFTTPGTSLYASLHSADPGLTGASELSGNAYARVQVTTWDAPSNGATANTSAITWSTPTPSGYGTATYMGLRDALTAGNFLLSANLDVSYLTKTTEAPIVGAGDFDVVVA